MIYSAGFTLWVERKASERNLIPKKRRPDAAFFSISCSISSQISRTSLNHTTESDANDQKSKKSKMRATTREIRNRRKKKATTSPVPLSPLSHVESDSNIPFPTFDTPKTGIRGACFFSLAYLDQSRIPCFLLQFDHLCLFRLFRFYSERVSSGFARELLRAGTPVPRYCGEKKETK